MTTTKKYYVSSTWRRIGAIIIDGLIIQLVLFGSGYYSRLQLGEGFTYPWTSFALWSFGWFSFLFLMFGFFGGTPGKLALGLRIVGVQGSKHTRLSWMKAFLRSLLMLAIYPFFFTFAIAVAFFREDRRQLLDILAGTQVVQMHKRESHPQVRTAFAVVLILLGFFRIGGFYVLKDTVRFSAEGITFKVPEKNK